MPSGHGNGCLRFETLNHPKQSKAMTYFQGLGVLGEGLLRIFWDRTGWSRSGMYPPCRRSSELLLVPGAQKLVFFASGLLNLGVFSLED